MGLQNRQAAWHYVEDHPDTLSLGEAFLLVTIADLVPDGETVLVASDDYLAGKIGRGNYRIAWRLLRQLVDHDGDVLDRVLEADEGTRKGYRLTTVLSRDATNQGGGVANLSRDATELSRSSRVTRPYIGNNRKQGNRKQGDQSPNFDPGDCPHLPEDEDGYCTACKTWRHERPDG